MEMEKLCIGISISAAIQFKNVNEQLSA
uniref:Uncharacterized protein n=1 Tax=Arundo donax TaxID=35708 RepID=A0A0A9AE10_ARUDO